MEIIPMGAIFYFYIVNLFHENFYWKKHELQENVIKFVL